MMMIAIKPHFDRIPLTIVMLQFNHTPFIPEPVDYWQRNHQSFVKIEKGKKKRMIHHCT